MRVSERALRRLGGRALVACLIVGCWAAAPAGSREPDATIGVVKTVSGTAFIDRRGASLTPLAGLRIELGDRLRTGADGALGVTLRDGTLIALGADTQFVVETFAFKPQRGLLGFVGRLLRGDAVYTSGEIGRLAPESVEFHVPGGVVGVRGTRFAARAR